MKLITYTWIAICMLSFAVGFMGGMVGQQKMFVNSAVGIASAIEGNNFELNVDINETIMVDRIFKLVNETFQQDVKTDNSEVNHG